MPNSRVCPACGSNETRRSRRRGARERLLSLGGIYPYVCKNCRKRFWADRKRWAAKALLAAVCLALALAAGWWLFQAADSPVSRSEPTPPTVQGDLDSKGLELRQQTDALAKSLADLRREKNELQAELLALRRQLTGPAHADGAAARPEPLSTKPARKLLGRIPFATGSITINADGGKLLKTIAQRLEQSNMERVLARGNADFTLPGARTAALGLDNAGLAMARAMSVYRALLTLGVDQKRLSAAVSGAPARDEKALGTVGVWLLSPASAPLAAGPPPK